MQLKDLVKPIDQLSDDELLDRLRTLRHKREVIRPAARKHVERAEVKVARKKVSELDKLVAGLSAADREALMKQLEDKGS